MKENIKSLLIISLLFTGFLLLAQEDVDTCDYEVTEYSEKEFTFQDADEDDPSFIDELVNEIVDVNLDAEPMEWDTSNIDAIKENFVSRSFDTTSLAVFRNSEDFDFSEAQNSESAISQFLKRLSQKLFGKLNTGMNSKWLRYLIILLATVIIVWFILKNELRTFVKKRDGASIAPKSGDLDISVSKDILLEKLEKAELDGKYRDAVRYSYLMTLKKMNEENVIHWKDYKLGQDYVDEIKDQQTKQDFQGFTDHFNYAWYGNYEVGGKFYAKVKAFTVSIQEKMTT